jgi:hypothetical protein
MGEFAMARDPRTVWQEESIISARTKDVFDWQG